MTKPVDLRSGARIVTATLGTLTVIDEPYADVGPEAAAKWDLPYLPDDDRIEVDVQVDKPTSAVDADAICAEVRTRDVQLLSLRPLTYRLHFHPDTDVTTEV